MYPYAFKFNGKRRRSTLGTRGNRSSLIKPLRDPSPAFDTMGKNSRRISLAASLNKENISMNVTDTETPSFAHLPVKPLSKKKIFEDDDSLSDLSNVNHKPAAMAHDYTRKTVALPQEPKLPELLSTRLLVDVKPTETVEEGSKVTHTIETRVGVEMDATHVVMTRSRTARTSLFPSHDRADDEANERMNSTSAVDDGFKPFSPDTSVHEADVTAINNDVDTSEDSFVANETILANATASLTLNNDDTICEETVDDEQTKTICIKKEYNERGVNNLTVRNPRMSCNFGRLSITAHTPSLFNISEEDFEREPTDTTATLSALSGLIETQRRLMREQAEMASEHRRLAERHRALEEESKTQLERMERLKRTLEANNCRSPAESPTEQIMGELKTTLTYLKTPRMANSSRKSIMLTPHSMSFCIKKQFEQLLE